MDELPATVDEETGSVSDKEDYEITTTDVRSVQEPAPIDREKLQSTFKRASLYSLVLTIVIAVLGKRLPPIVGTIIY